MDVVVKVIIDEKEYERLLEIERKYQELTHLSQSGTGSSHAKGSKITSNIPLDEIVIRNEEANAVETPIAGVLPSITTPTEEGVSRSAQKQKNEQPKEGAGAGEETADSSEKKDEELGIPKFVYPWYYIGPPHT